MLGDATYRQRTAAFNVGSYFQGDWSEGSKMLFLGPGENSQKDDGMVSRIQNNRKYKYIFPLSIWVLFGTASKI